MREIGDNIVELSCLAVLAFFIWGVGYMIMRQMQQTDMMYEACISADKQWIEGNCVR